MTKQLITFEEVYAKIMQHVRERHWENNASRSLAISIALEASELL